MSIKPLFHLKEDTPKTMYMLTKGAGIGKVSDLKGQKIQLSDVLVFDDVDDASGEIKTVCTIQTVDGNRYGTNSPTFVKDVQDIASCFGSEFPPELKVTVYKSRNNRDYIRAELTIE